ncbi:MAG: COR domain-containing protein [Hyphomicrobiales bacterium]
MNPKAKAIIEREKRERTGTLDLGNCGLTEIPKKIRSFTWITTLDISYNQIQRLENLPNSLKSLIIWNNQIQKLENLPNNLKDLIIWSNQIQKLENLPVSLNKLYINSNKIKKLENLPNSLKNLTIWNNQIQKLENLPISLKRLDIRSNKIQKLENLTFELSKLDISSNKIQKLENLPNSITELNIRSNKIQKLENLLVPLKKLDISYNQVQKLENLPVSLISLSISDNKIQKLENLPNFITVLDIRSNKIQKLENLPNSITVLDIRSNKIQKLENLSNSITELNISYNQIQKLENLPNSITELNISYNQIQKLENLPVSLNKLDINSNQIQKLENLSNSITELNISYNQIQDLKSIEPQIINGHYPLYWSDYIPYKGINLKNNPLITPPPEIIRQGKKAMINYLQELEEQGHSKLLEAKILIIGDARVGKTTLYRKLKDVNSKLPLEEDSTKGIDIHTMDFNDIKANIWDFGGQEIYHSTHQFFLTKRSLYIFVDDTSRDDIDYDYWFQLIEILSAKSPVLIVQNRKADRHKEFDSRGFKGQYENIKNVYSINLSLKTEEDKERFEKLKKEISFHISQLPHIGIELPKNWLDIRKELGKIAKDKPYISNEYFFEICKSYNITDINKKLHLSEFFHDLGVFLHFQEDHQLKHKIILQKEWATNAVYKVLDDNHIIENRGRFNEEDASQIWKNSDYENMNKEFIALMENFELIYPLQNTNNKQYLIPTLLPIEQTKFNWDYNNNIKLIYKYDFMPKGLISRFIVRRHRLIKEESVWRKGVILEREGAEALVIEDSKTKSIEIKVKGENNHNIKYLITNIKNEFDIIHNGFYDIKVLKLIPCNCNECSQNKHPYYYQYDSLIRRKDKGKQTVECDNSYEDINIQSLLDSIFIDIDSNEDIEKVKIFISYSKDNKEQVDKFRKYLGQYKGHYKFTPWYDGDLKCGDEWNPEIKRNLNEADLIIFLVSNDFLATDYIRDVEIETAMERHRKGETKILPVILTDCNWQSKINPLNKITCFPEKGRPIYETDSITAIEKGWTSILNQIELFLKER